MVLHGEIREFLESRRHATHEAAQRAALQIVCGLDLGAVLGGSRDLRQKALAKTERMVKRERHRGALRHWSYDLNRHIALKQVCDRSAGGARGPCAASCCLASAVGGVRARRPLRQRHGVCDLYVPFSH